MKSYVWLTFAFMGWGYYEMSGGADFEPEQRVLAAATSAEPEIVTRAETTTLLSVSSSNVTPQPEMSDAEITQAVAAAVALDTMEAAPEVVEIAAPVVEPKLDIRAVAGSRVNMRMGPSTDYDVITTLEGGTKFEVLSVNADGWANVSTERGIEGWMAKRLLTDPET
jgi:uncharacterized protein YgiM (DUF1202 family)